MKKLDKAAKIATIIVAILSFLTFIINYLLWWMFKRKSRTQSPALYFPSKKIRKIRVPFIDKFPKIPYFWIMVTALENRKQQLIQDILKLEKEEDVSKIEAQVKEIQSSDDFISKIKPTRKGVTLEQLIEEQNYTPIKREEFFAKTKALDIQEPLEDLLAQLTPWTIF